jgi:two-component system LytT family response regulator
MRVLIADDERLARDEIRRLLHAHPEVVVAGEATNVDDTIAAVASLDPDVLLLDIRMPGGTGFDVLERLNHLPAVIFTTAYDEFAVRAFEVSALDYLVKPIRPDRLASALARAASSLPHHPTGTAGATSPPGPRLERVFIRDGDRCWLIATSSIALFEAEGNYTRVCFDGHRPLVRTTLQSLEARLDPAMFFRASRAHLINLRFVERLEPDIADGLRAHLRGGQEIIVSRRQARRLRDAWSL